MKASKAAFSCPALQCPLLDEFDLPALIPGAHAGEVLQAIRGDERVALEVEKDVACRRFRQPCQATAGFEREPLDLRHLGAAAGHLQPGLLAEPLVGGDGAASGLGGQSAFALRDGGDRGQALLLEFAHLGVADGGDERRMVVGPPLLVAMAPVDAGIAVRHRVRIRARRRRHGHRSLHPGARKPVVRGELRRAVGFLPERRDDVNAIRRHALHRLQQFGVGAQLQDRAGLRLERQLGVGGFVGVPGQRRGRGIHAQQHVGDAAEHVVAQRGLHNGAEATLPSRGGWLQGRARPANRKLSGLRAAAFRRKPVRAAGRARASPRAAGRG